MAEKYKNLKVKDLQELLQKNGLPHSGKKEELIERLVKYDERKLLEINGLDDEFAGLEDFDESKLNLEELADPDLALHDSKPSETEAKADPTQKDSPTKTASAPPPATAPLTTEPKDEGATTKSPPTEAVATATATITTEEPKVVEKPGSSFKYIPITFDKTSMTASSDTKQQSEAEKKLERAKRFGLPENDQAKKEKRAERFGATNTASNDKKGATPAANLGIDPEVLKKRAERFGLPIKDSLLEEERKKKRAARFGVESLAKKAKNQA